MRCKFAKFLLPHDRDGKVFMSDFSGSLRIDGRA